MPKPALVKSPKLTPPNADKNPVFPVVPPVAAPEPPVVVADTPDSGPDVFVIILSLSFFNL
jgi:hypothetical protein